MPDRLRYIVGGQIAASDINEELNRGGQMAIWEARNGYYGGINDASGYRPFANGQSGYEYNDWWGYTHSASRPYVYIFKYEAEVSVSIRLYKYNPYGGQEWGEQWYFYNTGPWTNASDVTGVPVRMDDRVTFLWNHFGSVTNSRFVDNCAIAYTKDPMAFYGLFESISSALSGSQNLNGAPPFTIDTEENFNEVKLLVIEKLNNL